MATNNPLGVSVAIENRDLVITFPRKCETGLWAKVGLDVYEMIRRSTCHKNIDLNGVISVMVETKAELPMQVRIFQFEPVVDFDSIKVIAEKAIDAFFIRNRRHFN